MNAPNPIPPPASGGDTHAYEPSMEEILASIRRIIADDQSLPTRARAEEAAAVEAAPASVHVLRVEDSSGLKEQPHDPESVEPAPAQLEHEDNAMMPQGLIAAPQFPSPEMPMPQPVAAAQPTPILSDRLEAIHQQAHGEPAKQEIATRLGGSDDYFDPPEEHDRPGALQADAGPLFSATTNSSVASAFNVLAASRLADNSDELLGMAKDMIRPLLRTWLDENLPSMVERLVRDEIERVARGGR